MVVLNLQAPYPAPKWKGTFKATEHYWCRQYFGIFGVVGIEDCLQANVYVPAMAKRPLPVMVYIHGGAFVLGNGGKFMYGPDFIVKQDVIMVTLNYRLEVLGFLCLGIKEAPGNAGLKDQIAALKWVQKNIAAFGGDPDNVTLFGESAGSGSVSALLGSNAANGLFKRAILQSGFSVSSWAIHQNPVKIASILAKSLGYNTEDPHELFKIFSNLPVEDLIIKKDLEIMDLVVEPQLIHMPCVEKAIPGVEPVLSDSPYNLLSKKAKDIPVIYGTTSKEGWLLIPEENEKTIDKWNHRYLFGADMEIPSKAEAADVDKKLKEFYFKNEKINMKHISNLTDFYTQFFFEIPGILESEILLGVNNAPVYNFIFNYSGDRNVLRLRSGFANEPGASHGDDLFYLFRASIWPFRVSEKDQKMIDWMTKMWTNFAKYGWVYKLLIINCSGKSA